MFALDHRLTSSQLKQPASYTRQTGSVSTSSSASSLGRSAGPARQNTIERPQTRASRPIHGRSKSTVARPRTVHGHRNEKEESPNNGTRDHPIPEPQTTPLNRYASPTGLPKRLSSLGSLSNGMARLSLYDTATTQNQVIPPTSRSSSQMSIASGTTNVTLRPKARDKQNRTASIRATKEKA